MLEINGDLPGLGCSSGAQFTRAMGVVLSVVGRDGLVEPAHAPASRRRSKAIATTIDLATSSSRARLG